jgi:hypothetical protein
MVKVPQGSLSSLSPKKAQGVNSNLPLEAEVNHAASTIEFTQTKNGKT